MKRYIIVLFVLFVSLTAMTNAQWKMASVKCDTTFHKVNDFCELDETMYAATSAGLLVSITNGLNWTISATYPLSRTYEMRIENNVLYVDGLKTTDYGITWVPTDISERLLGIDTLNGKPRFFAFRIDWAYYKNSLADSVGWKRAFLFDLYTDSIGYQIWNPLKILNDPQRGTMLPSKNGMIYPKQILDGLNPDWWRRDPNMHKPLFSFLMKDSVYVFGSQGTIYSLQKDAATGWDSLSAGLSPAFAVTSLIQFNGTLIAATQTPDSNGNLFRLRPGSRMWERVFVHLPCDNPNTSNRQAPVYAIARMDSFLFIGTSGMWGQFIYYCPINQIVGYEPGLQEVYQNRLSPELSSYDLRIIGVNFYPDSKVYIDGKSISTRYINTGTLYGMLDSSFFQKPDTFAVSVLNPMEGGCYSNMRPLYVYYPRAIISNISPISADIGTSPTIRVYGDNFFRKSRVVWGDLNVWLPGLPYGFDTLPTVYISDSLLEARPTPKQMSELANNRLVAVWNPNPNRILSKHYGQFSITDPVNSVKQEIDIGIPIEFSLSENYPNPFNPRTAIRLGIPHESPLLAAIYDLTGRKIETLVERNVFPGWYTLEWNADEYASGIYILRVTAKEFTATRRLLLLK